MITGSKIMIRAPVKGTRASTGTTRASAVKITVMRMRRMSRMMPQYSSAGIWPVFQRRWQVGHSHRSP